MRVNVPPIKCQGIKTKIVPLILRSVEWNFEETWYEPFMGSGVVGFNVMPKRAVFADTNPYLISFYQALQRGEIDGFIVRAFLEEEGAKLSNIGAEYYYEVRERFNNEHNPLDFLFLNRSCFNGLIRFNGSGGFNVPFGHKPQRFSKAYITKIVNQFNYVYVLSRNSDWRFVCQDFRDTLSLPTEEDFVYCDPPYVGRHVDYYDSWDDEEERSLFGLLSKINCQFILSSWHSNQHRENKYLKTLWSQFHVLTKKHFYHVGAKETNRKPMLEALIMNFTPMHRYEEQEERPEQLLLFNKISEYQAITNQSTGRSRAGEPFTLCKKK